MTNYVEFRGPGFTLEAPSDWLITSSTQYQAMFVAPLSGDVRPNLMITLRPVSAEVTAAEVAEVALQTQRKEYAEYEILEEKDFSESGGSGIYRQYRWLELKKGNYIVQTQYYFVYDQVIYTMTATRLDSTNPELDEIFRHIIFSFRLTVAA